jgi:hypothetical protein
MRSTREGRDTVRRMSLVLVVGGLFAALTPRVAGQRMFGGGCAVLGFAAFVYMSRRSREP